MCFITAQVYSVCPLSRLHSPDMLPMLASTCLSEIPECIVIRNNGQIIICILMMFDLILRFSFFHSFEEIFMFLPFEQLNSEQLL